MEVTVEGDAEDVEVVVDDEWPCAEKILGTVQTKRLLYRFILVLITAKLDVLFCLLRPLFHQQLSKTL